MRYIQEGKEQFSFSPLKIKRALNTKVKDGNNVLSLSQDAPGMW